MACKGPIQLRFAPSPGMALKKKDPMHTTLKLPTRLTASVPLAMLLLLSKRHMQALQRPISKKDKFRINDRKDEIPTTLTCQMAFLAVLVMGVCRNAYPLTAMKGDMRSLRACVSLVIPEASCSMRTSSVNHSSYAVLSLQLS